MAYALADLVSAPDGAVSVPAALFLVSELLLGFALWKTAGEVERRLDGELAGCESLAELSHGATDEADRLAALRERLLAQRRALVEQLQHVADGRLDALPPPLLAAEL